MRNYPINFVVKHPNHLVVLKTARPGAVKTCRCCWPVSRSASPLKLAAIWKQRMKFGGAERDRTADPLLAKQVLSQLSYSPPLWVPAAEMVGLGRFEVPTSPLSGVRSNQLSYRP